MGKFDFLNLSSTFGLIATGFLTFNLLLGLLLSLKYKWSRVWQRMPPLVAQAIIRAIAPGGIARLLSRKVARSLRTAVWLSCAFAINGKLAHKLALEQVR